MTGHDLPAPDSVARVLGEAGVPEDPVLLRTLQDISGLGAGAAPEASTELAALMAAGGVAPAGRRNKRRITFLGGALAVSMGVGMSGVAAGTFSVHDGADDTAGTGTRIAARPADGAASPPVPPNPAPGSPKDEAAMGPDRVPAATGSGAMPRATGGSAELRDASASSGMPAAEGGTGVWRSSGASGGPDASDASDASDVSDVSVPSAAEGTFGTGRVPATREVPGAAIHPGAGSSGAPVVADHAGRQAVPPPGAGALTAGKRLVAPPPSYPGTTSAHADARPGGSVSDERPMEYRAAGSAGGTGLGAAESEWAFGNSAQSAGFAAAVGPPEPYRAEPGLRVSSWEHLRSALEEGVGSGLGPVDQHGLYSLVLGMAVADAGEWIPDDLLPVLPDRVPAVIGPVTEQPGAVPRAERPEMMSSDAMPRGVEGPAVVEQVTELPGSMSPAPEHPISAAPGRAPQPGEDPPGGDAAVDVVIPEATPSEDGTPPAEDPAGVPSGSSGEPTGR